MKVNKTNAGMQALSERDKRLTSKMRMLLVTVDGSHDESEIRQIGLNIGAPEGAFDKLFALGLIAVEQHSSSASDPAAVDQVFSLDAFGRFRMASAIMNELASDAMGLKAFFFVLKVERCGSTADLAKLMPVLEPVVRKAHGEVSAKLLLKPLKLLLSDEQ
jgi:hypothetical protein